MAYFGYPVQAMALHGDYLYLHLLDFREAARNDPDFEPYFRWNGKTGTWSRPFVRKGAQGRVAWKTLPCAQDCFLPQVSGGSVVYDFKGRKLDGSPNRSRGAAGVRLIKTRR